MKTKIEIENKIKSLLIRFLSAPYTEQTELRIQLETLRWVLGEEDNSATTLSMNVDSLMKSLD